MASFLTSHPSAKAPQMPPPHPSGRAPDSPWAWSFSGSPRCPTVTSGLSSQLQTDPHAPVRLRPSGSFPSLPGGAAGWSWVHGLLPWLRTTTFSNAGPSAGHFIRPLIFLLRQKPLPSSLSAPHSAPCPAPACQIPAVHVGLHGARLGPRGRPPVSACHLPRRGGSFPSDRGPPPGRRSRARCRACAALPRRARGTCPCPLPALCQHQRTQGLCARMDGPWARSAPPCFFPRRAVRCS